MNNSVCLLRIKLVLGSACVAYGIGFVAGSAASCPCGNDIISDGVYCLSVVG